MKSDFVLKADPFLLNAVSLSVQVRESSVNTLVEIYRHVGEKVLRDLKKGLSQQR